jgi:hypothetical protein
MTILYIRDELNQRWLPVVTDLGSIPDVVLGDVLPGYSLYYAINSGSGRWEARPPNRQLIFTLEGSVELGASPFKIDNHTGAELTLSGVYLRVGTPPTGSDLIIDIHKDDVTIFTDQDNRPTITSGSETGFSTDLDVTAWADGSYLLMEVDQIGSGNPGADLVVIVVYS